MSANGFDNLLRRTVLGVLAILAFALVGSHLVAPDGALWPEVDLGGPTPQLRVGLAATPWTEVARVLSPAVVVIEEMTFLFPEIAKAPLGPYAVPDTESWPRVVVYARSFGELVELATTQIVLYGITDPNVLTALRRFATSLNLLDLNDDDQRYVDEFAAKLESAPTASPAACISTGG